MVITITHHEKMGTRLVQCLGLGLGPLRMKNEEQERGEGRKRFLKTRDF